MSQKRQLTLVTRTLAVVGVALALAVAVPAKPNFKVLHHFPQSEGVSLTGFVADAAGNLYGTTYNGGSNFSGTVFELSPTSGGWKRTVLYNFQGRKDGATPYGNLIFDAAGNLYGTTQSGGHGPCDCGTVFELVPKTGGGWEHFVLYRFQGGADGSYPWAGVILDSAGNLYGTTTRGGSGASGTVFELTPTFGGGWTETVIYAFGGGTDGRFPYGGLVSDSAGNLYGTTRRGGLFPYLAGVVFELQPSGSGWTEVVIHNFDFTGDGHYPNAKLIFDGSGNLYGTTRSGGPSGAGTVFELTPGNGGSWTEEVVHAFGGKNGKRPDSGLVFDSAGSLYGQTFDGECSTGQLGCSMVYQLTPQGGGWKETVLHRFATTSVGNWYSSSGVIVDTAGNVYGTFASALGGDGIAFKIAK